MERKNIKARSLELQEKGQGESETIRLWGSTVRSKLALAKAPEYLIVDTFINGLRYEELKKKMRKRMAMEEGMEIKQAVEVVEKLQAGLLGQKEGGFEKKVVEEEKGLVAPVF